MASPSKNKGDRYERFLRDLFRSNGFPNAERTRAGYERDAGDIHLNPEGRKNNTMIICQAKDVRQPRWAEWLEQLKDQIDESRAETAFLAVKRSRPGKKPIHLFVMELEEGLELLKKVNGKVE